MSLNTHHQAHGANMPSTQASRRPRVCLVTEELSGVGGSGGIGAAFHELALLLSANAHDVDILYCPIEDVPTTSREALRERFAARGIKLMFLDERAHVDGERTHEKRAYAVHRTLLDGKAYDVIHFHDYKGLGAYAANAKRQGLAYEATRLVVQLHGPTRWTIEANRAFFSHEDQLKIDFLERMSIRNADDVVSPSAYLVDWVRANGFELPPDDRVHVIKNVCTSIINEMRGKVGDGAMRPRVDGVTDLVLFARHEDRKGFGVFCDALDRVADLLASKGVTVTFMGKLGTVDAQPSGVYLLDRSASWPFNYRVRTGFDRTAAIGYIGSLASPVAVIPSPFENSPYTVLEMASMGVPLVSSSAGGGPELVEPGYPGICEINADALAAKLRQVVLDGLAPARLAEPLEQIEAQWLAFHRTARGVRQAPVSPAKGRAPRVAFAITHFQRPDKLVDAIMSAVRQTYENLEIIVVDDGSSDEATLAALGRIETLVSRVGGRLIRRENGYLGAARNTAVSATDAEYICFLDDDDVAFPDMVSTLVTAALNTDADVVNCLNVYMPVVRRAEMMASIGGPARIGNPAYIPMGGPLSLAVTENCLGAATSLLKVNSLKAVGGYSEIKGVGHEDYELYLRMLQAGMSIEIVPEALYYYEVGRPSMLSRTSLPRNFRRCFDTVDTGSNEGAWKDMLSLSLGKKVAIDAHNRQWWLYSLQPTAAIRHELMSPGLGREGALKSLVRLAQAESNPKMCMALLDDLASSHGGTMEEGQWVSVAGSALRRAHSPVAAPWVTDVKLDMALGRSEDAVDRLIKAVVDSGRVDPSLCDLVLDAVRGLPDPSRRSRAHDLAVAIESAFAPQEYFQVVASTVAFLELIASGVTASKTLIGVVEADEQRYLEVNQDVRVAVENGQFPSARSHFLSHGFREKRHGFEGTQRIARAMAACGVDCPADLLIGRFA